MDDLQSNALFNSISVISGRWDVDNERLCAMELRFTVLKISPRAEMNSVRYISRTALNPLSYRSSYVVEDGLVLITLNIV